MLNLYRFILSLSAPLLLKILRNRVKKGKESAIRLSERQGITTKPRPNGKLIWIHAASVGEAQSALILITSLLDTYKNLHILITTGTLTSADMMAKNLPNHAIHQFYPLDHPKWVNSFLDHWTPDIAFWMESELWPNMLGEVKRRSIPAALINARLSDKSYSNWKIFKSSARGLLSTFDLILAQTEKHGEYYRALGAHNVIVTDNIKYSAKPLPVDETALNGLLTATKNRPLWLYASTHAGEEEMACRIHQALKAKHPNLLTIIAPRHPNRRDDIQKSCSKFKLNITLRGENHTPPTATDDIYIADTLGELGLLYRLSAIACIGRSFSDDGGGGHNPIEAAQLNCAILYGPNVQYQQQIFDDMRENNAATQVQTQDALTQELDKFLKNEKETAQAQQFALEYANKKTKIINTVLKSLGTILKTLDQENATTQQRNDECA